MCRAADQHPACMCTHTSSDTQELRYGFSSSSAPHHVNKLDIVYESSRGSSQRVWEEEQWTCNENDEQSFHEVWPFICFYCCCKLQLVTSFRNSWISKARTVWWSCTEMKTEAQTHLNFVGRLLHTVGGWPLNHRGHCGGGGTLFLMDRPLAWVWKMIDLSQAWCFIRIGCFQNVFSRWPDTRIISSKNWAGSCSWSLPSDSSVMSMPNPIVDSELKLCAVFL